MWCQWQAHSPHSYRDTVEPADQPRHFGLWAGGRSSTCRWRGPRSPAGDSMIHSAFPPRQHLPNNLATPVANSVKLRVGRIDLRWILHVPTELSVRLRAASCSCSRSCPGRPFPTRPGVARSNQGLHGWHDLGKQGWP